MAKRARTLGPVAVALLLLVSCGRTSPTEGATGTLGISRASAADGVAGAQADAGADGRNGGVGSATDGSDDADPSATSSGAAGDSTDPGGGADEEPGSEPDEPTVLALNFVAAVDDLADLPEAVRAAASDAEPSTIDRLAVDACRNADPASGAAGVGEQAVAAYDRAETPLAEQLGLADFATLYGAVIGFFCPERLNASEAAGFLAEVAEGSILAGQAQDFVLRTRPDRLDRLTRIVCASTEPAMSLEAFGTAAVDGHQRHLDDDERAAIEVDAFVELYGAIVGWFCPDKLPTG